MLRNPDDPGFQPVQGAPPPAPDEIPASTFVGAAYAFIWFAVLLFLALLWRRARQTAAELDLLQRKLEAKGVERSSKEASSA